MTENKPDLAAAPGGERPPKRDISIIGPVNGMNERDLSGAYFRVVLTGKNDEREAFLISLGAAEVVLAEMAGLLTPAAEMPPDAGLVEALRAEVKALRENRDYWMHKFQGAERWREQRDVAQLALRDMRVWVQHWQKDRDCGLIPSAETLQIALARIDTALSRAGERT